MEYLYLLLIFICMNILIVTATAMEMEAVSQAEAGGEVNFLSLITGPGLMQTAYHLGQFLAGRPVELAINAGIAGSFSAGLKPGTLVQVSREMLADFGAEDGETFLSGFDIGLVRKDNFPFTDGWLVNPYRVSFPGAEPLTAVNGITVNTVHGNEKSIAAVSRRFHPDIETMEGAAFFYACLSAGIPFVEIRAISNYVEGRDKTKWKTREALESLKSYTRQLVYHRFALE